MDIKKLNEELEKLLEDNTFENEFENAAIHLAEWLHGTYVKEHNRYVITGKFYDKDIKLVISSEEMSIEFIKLNKKQHIEQLEVDYWNHDAFTIQSYFKRQIKSFEKNLNINQATIKS